MNVSGGESAHHTELTEPDEQIRLAKTLLTINEAYKETIDEKLAQLRRKLEANQARQSELLQQITENNSANATGTPSKDKSLRNNAGQEANGLRGNEILLNRIRWVQGEFWAVVKSVVWLLILFFFPKVELF